MITYTWNIAQLDCAPIENGLANVIKTIHWTYTAQETDGDQLISSCNNYYPLTSPAPEQFVDFETLTEDQVIGWLENSLDMSILQNNLANQIIAQRNPPIRPLPLPWGKIVEETPEVAPDVVEEVVEPEPEVILDPVEEVVEPAPDVVEEVVEPAPDVVEEVVEPEPEVILDPVEEVVEPEPEVIPDPVEEVVEPEPEVIPDPVEETVEPEPTLEELIDAGYNPDARDGDGDGLVQDGTEWERPIDTQP